MISPDPVLQVHFGSYFSASLRSIMFWTLFTGIHVGLFAFGWIRLMRDPDLTIFTDLGYSVLISRSAGLVLCFDCTILIIPACRNLIRAIRSPVINKWIPFDDGIFLHKVTAYFMLFFTLLHVNGHYNNMFQLPGYLKEVFKNSPKLMEQYSDYSSLTTGSLHYWTYAGLTGHGMLYVMFFMFTTTAKLIRKIRFETFIHTHHLYALFYIFLFLHSFGCFFRTPGGECKGYNTKYYIAPVFIFFLIDRMIRVYRSREDTQISDVIIHAGKVIELRFEKPSMIYNPGQYLYVNIPEISKFQWHPFTISSTPQEGFISVHIKVVGDWTGALYNMFNTSKNQFPSIRVDGPYGAPAQDLFRYETSILVSAGIGVTPSAGLLKSVWYAYMRKAPMKLQKLHLIWVCRDMQDIACFQSLLYTLEENVPSSFVDSKIYLTGKLGSTDIANIMYNESNDKSDQITQLRSKTLFGRPQWEKIFESIKNEINPVKSNTEVGVFFCGPPVMGDALKKQANRSSTNSFKFIVHEENFE